MNIKELFEILKQYNCSQEKRHELRNAIMLSEITEELELRSHLPSVQLIRE